MKTSMKIVLLLGVVFLQACGTRAYTPTVYELRDNVIPPFNVAGQVKIVNAQTSIDPAIVYSYAGTKLETNYKIVTATLIEHAERELKKNGRMSGNRSAKTIELKVTFLQSKYIAFFWKSKMTVEAKLGNGRVVNLDVAHGSGNIMQDLNGCIAEGAIVLFKNETVRAYLAK